MYPEIIKFSNELPVSIYPRCIEQYPYHWHDTLEIIQVLKGFINVGIGDESIVLGENDVAIVNIGELHRIMRSRENETLFIQVDAGFYRKLLKNRRYIYLYCCSACHKAETSDKYKILREHITRLVREFHNRPGVGCKKKIESILTTMLDFITYNFDFLRWGYGSKAFDEKLVERLIHMANLTTEYYEMSPGLKDLAGEVDVSLYHLSHDIKSKFGIPFMNLLCYSKCEHAAKLLLSTNKRIVDITFECRFSDPKYLIKYFKQFFQCTPSEFRKTYKTDLQALMSQVSYRDISFQ